MKAEFCHGADPPAILCHERKRGEGRRETRTWCWIAEIAFNFIPIASHESTRYFTSVRAAPLDNSTYRLRLHDCTRSMAMLLHLKQCARKYNHGESQHRPEQTRLIPAVSYCEYESTMLQHDLDVMYINMYNTYVQRDISCIMMYVRYTAKASSYLSRVRR